MSPSTPQIANMDALTVAASSLPGKRIPTHVYFFGYQGPDPEVYFQQWYPSPFTDTSLPTSLEFKTSEYHTMYRQALLFGDEVVAAKILVAETPGQAKNLGRQAGPFDQMKWNEECGAIVEQGKFLKFSQNPELKEVLLNTGSKIIVEPSPTDRVWGIGSDAEHAGGQEAEWGVNKLGEALMRVRERLRRE